MNPHNPTRISRIYLFTNENISEYLKRLGNLNGKSVLSVAASGDHAFEAYLAGAKYVDTFDLNPGQKSVMDLKNIMIRNIKYEDFMNFFFSHHDFFNIKIVKPLWSQLSPDAKNLLSQYNSFGRKIFHDVDLDPDKTNAYYSTKQKYETLQTILPSTINFTNCNLAELSSVLSAQYDIMLLSNIFDYMYEGINYVPQKLSCFYHSVLMPLISKSLNENDGFICFHYIWTHGYYTSMPKHWYGAVADFSQHIKNTNNKIYLEMVPSVRIGLDTDLIAVLRKEKRR